MTEISLCFRDPIPEIMQAAQLLDYAVTSYMNGNKAEAEALIIKADIPAIREWTESLWGKKSPYVKVYPVENSSVDINTLAKDRMPKTAVKRSLHERDGYHCRFCRIPVIRSEVRARMKKAMPESVYWSSGNLNQHAAFQAMWAHYDHIVPHSKGGSNELDNMVIACAPCNCARMQYTLEQVRIADPHLRSPINSKWDGLERFPL